MYIPIKLTSSEIPGNNHLPVLVNFIGTKKNTSNNKINDKTANP